MPRTRNIKPGYFKNESLAECEPLARIVYAGLWTIADREGRLEDRPKRIKAEVLPYDNADVDVLLSQLARHDFIVRYEANGYRYIQVVNWAKHQQPHVKEQASTIPPVPETVQAPNLTGASLIQAPVKPATSTEVAALNTSSLILNPTSLAGEVGEGGSGGISGATQPRAAPAPPPGVVSMPEHVRQQMALQEQVFGSAADLKGRPLTQSERKRLTGWFNTWKRRLSCEIVEEAEGETAGHTSDAPLDYFTKVMQRMIEHPEATKPQNGRKGGLNGTYRQDATQVRATEIRGPNRAGLGDEVAKRGPAPARG